jgi:hypothetical protein
LIRQFAFRERDRWGAARAMRLTAWWACRIAMPLLLSHMCIAQRVVGPHPKKIAPPPQPTGCSATLDVDGSVTLEWNPLPGGTVSSYVILGIREGQARHAMTGRLPTVPTRHTIRKDQLVAGARYMFQVAPINVHSHGPPSKATAAVTIPADTRPSPADMAGGDPAPGQPATPTVSLNTDGSVLVTWLPLADKATNYVVLATREGQPRHAITSRLPTTPTQVKIPANELLAGSKYTFQVAALNGNTHGPPSAAAAALLIPGAQAAVTPFNPASERSNQAAAKPGRPTGFQATANADGTVSVQWDALPAHTVTSYVILATREGKPRHAITDRLPTSPTWKTIRSDELVPGARYSFQVAPVNSNAHGPPSVASAMVTISAASSTARVQAAGSAAAPDRASKCLAQLNADGSVLVSWLGLPERATAYVILATRDGEPRHAVTGRLPGSPTEYSIAADHLVPGSSYTFQVAAINVHTHGPPGPASAQVTIPKGLVAGVKPPRVTGAAGRVDVDGSVTVAWDPLPAGAATNYVVLATRQGQPRHAITTRLPLHPTQTILGQVGLLSPPSPVQHSAPPRQSSLTPCLPVCQGETHQGRPVYIPGRHNPNHRSY